MLDLGLFVVPYEALNWTAITVACLLAAMYIGMEVISAIVGTVTVIISLKTLIYKQPAVIAGFTIGTYEALFLFFVGAYLAFIGTRGFLDGKPEV